MDQDAQDVGEITEILVGFDALRFLCSMGKKQTYITESSVFSKLYSETQTRESTSLPSCLQASSTRSAFSRKQRKAYKPSRVLPVEEMACPPAKSTLTSDPPSSSNCPTICENSSLNKKKLGISGRGSPIMSDNPDKDSRIPKMMKGKRNKRQNLQCDANVVCKNLACKAVLQAEASFCRRCSCCICKQFDDNKDPSLWITCDPEEPGGCGLSCHAECALQDRVAGVVRINGLVSLDGSFLCRSCGKVSSLLSFWKKQLWIAKNARRVDVFCQRLLLSQRLLKGTLKYEDIHSFVNSAVEKLNVEVGLMNKCSAKLERCIVNRLSCNSEVQNMIDAALEKAESLCEEHSDVVNAKTADSFEKPVCNIQFEDACTSSIVVVAVDNHRSDDQLGYYKLWHREATDLSYPAAPTYTIQSTSKKVLVSNLQPNTMYAFKIAPYSSEHDAGEGCEAECRTQTMDTMAVENHVDDRISDPVQGTNNVETHDVQSLQQPSSTTFECIQEENAERCDAVMEDLNNVNPPKLHAGKDKHLVEVPGDLIAAGREEAKGSKLGLSESPVLPVVTDTHEEPQNEREEDLNNVGLYSSMHGGADRDSLKVLCNVIAVVNDDPKSLKQGACWSPELLRATETREEPRSQTEEVSVLKNAFIQSPTMAADVVEIVDERNPALECEAKESFWNGKQGGKLAVVGSGKDAWPRERSQAELQNIEFTIRVVCWLESQGHLNKDFRKKFVTWYSLRATEHEKRVVNVYIDTLQDSASSLADQLVDTFEDVVNTKRQRIMDIGVYRRRYK